MGRKYQVISADGHLETPPEGGWVAHVPEKYRDRAPRLIRQEDGGEAWQVEGLPLIQNGLNLTGGSPISYHNESYWNADGTPRPGTGTPQQRLREQDQDGIDAEVLYPPIYASRFIESITDRRVYMALVQAYNGYLAEYCSVAPDRLIGNGIVPKSGIEDALAELKRCKEIGLPSVSLGNWPNGGGSIDPDEDDRFWGAALEIGMPISPHGFIGDRQGADDPAARGLSTSNPPLANAIATTAPVGPMWAIAQLIASGTLDRFPELRLYFAETNAGWMPFSLFYMDDWFASREHLYPDHRLTMKPSEYAAKYFFYSFIRDPMAMKLRDYLPVESLMWGSDFPHSVGSFPESRKWIDIIFEGVPDDLRRTILVENPARFFGLDLNKDLTETPASELAGTGAV